MGMSSHICPQCGNALAPDETKCHICGTQYIEPAPRSAPANLRRTNLQTANSDRSQYTGLPPAPFGNMQPVQPTQSGQLSPSHENRNDESNAPSMVSLDAMPEGEGRSFGPISLPSFMQPVLDGKRPRLLLIAGIVILLLVLLGGSILALSRSSGGSTTALTHSTATATGNTLTATPPPMPLFTDNFADASKGWGIGSGRGFSSTIAHNTLTMLESNHRILDIAVPDKSNAPAIYGDFSATATFTLTKADQNDSVGLFVRGASVNGNFSQGYFVDIYGDNSYDVFKIFANAGKDAFLVDPTSSSFINPVGQQNKLTVAMKGPKMVVIINGKVLTTLSDNDYKRGEIALFVENGKSSNGVQASFSNVVVNPVPNQLPGS